jgi:poly-gamma-glutamate capsule biosynthesis protein CapA/YwtB (metallophosphatase superfamily)
MIAVLPGAGKAAHSPRMTLRPAQCTLPLATMKTVLLLPLFVSLASFPAVAFDLAVETAAEIWPVWERLAAGHPLPDGIQASRIDAGASSPGDTLVMTLGRGAGARVVERVALAPFAHVWDVGRTASLAEIRAGRIRTLPVESINLPDIALPVDDMFPDQPGYPLFTDVSMSLRSADLVLRSWFDSIPTPAEPRMAITWVGAVGDIMPARGVDSVLLGGEGALRVFGDTLPILATPQLLVGNLEAAATSAGTPEKKTYRFKFDSAALRVLKGIGFDYFSVANNHTFDYGTKGFLDTLSGLSQWGIGTSGAGVDEQQAEKPFVVTSGPLELRVLSFASYPVDRTGFDGRRTARAGRDKPGTLWLDQLGLEAATHAFSRGSFNIALVHGGEEWNTRPVAEQKRLYRELVRAGADVVIGSHPHVLQGMEAFEGGLIVYSLGNFLFPGMEGTRGGQDSMILKIGVVEGKARYLHIFPVRLEGTTVRLSTSPGVVDEVRALSRELNRDD